jgi:PKD repeat protein
MPGAKIFLSSDELPARGQRQDPVGRKKLTEQEKAILNEVKPDDGGTSPQVTTGPSPTFSASSYNPCSNQVVQFVGANTAGTFTWDFGDGSPTVSGIGLFSPTHSYMNAGAFTVTLTVTSSSGSASSSQQIFVTSCAPISGSQTNWFFGYFGELHFNTGVALPGNAALSHHTIFTSEASTAQSDANGNLLFYSDGRMIWNGLHALVNGGLNGGDHPVQTLSIPDPADPNPNNPSSFYLISMRGYVGLDDTNGNFGYTKVLASGSNLTLSSVNTPIAPPAGADNRIAEMVTAVPGCAANYWIIVHGSYLDSNPDLRHALFVYQLTAAGIQPATVYPIVGPALFGPLKASPDGTRIAYGTGDSRSAEKDGSNSGYSHVLDFNRKTGVPSNPRVINRYGYGVSFSPNSQLLYLTESVSGVERIFQYDLSTANLNDGEKLVADVPATYSALQLGPDNKIYVALNDNNNHLAVINYPNERNTVSAPNACGYSFNGPFLNIPSSSTSVASGFGLPNMIDVRKTSSTPADCCPVITLNPVVGALPGTVTNTPYSQTFTATGGTGPYALTVSNGTLPQGMSLDAAGLHGTPTAPGMSTFTVKATDVNGCAGTREYQMNVSCPVITLNPVAGALPGAVANTPYSQTITATGGTGPYAFTVSNGTLPQGLSLDAAGLHGAPTTPGMSTFTVKATDVNGCAGTREYQMNVSCSVITLNPAAGALPAALANTPYSHTFTATGGCASFSYSVTSGALPPGITLGANGVLLGTATNSGDFTFTVTATDSCGCATSQNYTLKVQNPAKILVISAFRENGPNGTGDEFIEIFNPSSLPVTVSSLSDDPNQAIGVFSSAGNGTASNDVFLRCMIPGATVIKGRGWFLCAGSQYSLSNLGGNGGTFHSLPDATILGDIPNDAGLALLNIGTDNVTACQVGNCSTGFKSPASPDGNTTVFDKVGFRPYGLGAPSPRTYPSMAPNYCEGTCLEPVGDASTIATLTCPPAVGPGSDPGAFPVMGGGDIDGVPVCYGESGQYSIDRRRSGQQFSSSAGDLHRDTDNNPDDFILVAPNPSSANVGLAITGVSGVSSVLGAAGPHSSSAPPMVGRLIHTQDDFDTCSGAVTPCTPGALSPRNAVRRYMPDVYGNVENDPAGTLILRRRFTNTSGTTHGARYRIDDITTLCGGQSLTIGISQVATQEARNLRGPDFSIPNITPIPSCQGEGADIGVFTAVFKALNHGQEMVVDSSGTARLVFGSTLEDTSVGAVGLPAVGRHQPFGGGGNSSFVATTAIAPVGDGVNGGIGSFAAITGPEGRIFRIAFKVGVVRSGRFKLLLGTEVSSP